MQPQSQGVDMSAIQRAMQKRGMGMPTPQLSQNTQATPSVTPPAVNSSTPSAMPQGMKRPIPQTTSDKTIILKALTSELARMGKPAGGQNVQQSTVVGQ